MAVETVITALGGGTLTGVLAYLGIRYSSRKSSEVQAASVENDARKVDREQFQAFVEEYQRDQKVLRKELDATNRKLRSSIGYIRVLRREMYNAGVQPSPIPEDLGFSADLW